MKQGDAGGNLDGNSEDNLNATDEIDITRETEYFDSNIFHRSSCMVIDPVDRGNNVARAFSRKNVQHLSSILSHGKICLVDALQCVSPSIEAVSTANDDDARAVFVQCAESILRAMFPASHTKFRAGRPDLLIHPRQRLGDEILDYNGRK